MPLAVTRCHCPQTKYITLAFPSAVCCCWGMGETGCVGRSRGTRVGVGGEGFESHLEASTGAEFHEQHLEF